MNKMIFVLAGLVIFLFVELLISFSHNAELAEELRQESENLAACESARMEQALICNDKLKEEIGNALQRRKTDLLSLDDDLGNLLLPDGLREILSPNHAGQGGYPAYAH